MSKKLPTTLKENKKIILQYLYEAHQLEMIPLATQKENYLEVRKYISFPVYTMTVVNIAMRYNDEFNTVIGTNQLQEILKSLINEGFIEEVNIYADKTSYKIVEKGISQLESNIFWSWLTNPENFTKLILALFTLVVSIIALYFKIK